MGATLDRNKALTGKTVLVTGAARRLGGALALALARNGVNVVVHYHRSAAAADALAAEIRGHGVQGWTLCADLEDPADAEALVPRACDLAGAVDVLINSAAIFPEDTLTDLTPEALHRNVAINALAPLLVARRFAAQDRPGAILNLLDARITDYDRAHAAYHLSKRMLHTLTRMMALEFAPRVRVNAIAPGLILPPEGQGAEYLERLAASNPLACHGGPEDVTRAALFLLESPFITGQTLYVDGGRHLIGNTYGTE